MADMTTPTYDPIPVRVFSPDKAAAALGVTLPILTPESPDHGIAARTADAIVLDRAARTAPNQLNIGFTSDGYVFGAGPTRDGRLLVFVAPPHLGANVAHLATSEGRNAQAASLQAVFDDLVVGDYEARDHDYARVKAAINARQVAAEWIRGGIRKGDAGRLIEDISPMAGRRIAVFYVPSNENDFRPAVILPDGLLINSEVFEEHVFGPTANDFCNTASDE